MGRGSVITDMRSSDSELEAVLDVVDRIAPQQMNREQEALLRRNGVYTQRPASDGFFMVRVRIPRGELTSAQLRAVADAADAYGRGLADITVRQNIQLHWIARETLPRVFELLGAAGLSTFEPRGGAVRNIVTCPVSGIDEDDLYDTDHIVSEVNSHFTDNREFLSLPRKLKVTITGCAVRCVYPEVHDIAIFAAPDFERGGVVFRARVGGGLSTHPHFSQDLGILVSPGEVVELCAAIASTLRDWDADRRRGRLSYLVEASEVPRFRADLEKRIGRSLRLAGDAEAQPVRERNRSHIGIRGQKTTGLYYIGLSILGGRTSGAALRQLAKMAERHGSGRIRTTNAQNAILVDVPERNLLAAADELDAAGLEYEPGWSRKGLIACSGVQFCKLALTETKNTAKWLTGYLENAVELDEPVRISVTGCANACGQHHISDIGLEGCLTTVDGARRESFQVLLGGGVGPYETLGRRIGAEVPADRVGEFLTRLLNRFRQIRGEGETFQEFCSRHTDEQLVEYLTAGDPKMTQVTQIMQKAQGTPGEMGPPSGMSPGLQNHAAEPGSFSSFPP